jgi:hypothetical protein
LDPVVVDATPASAGAGRFADPTSPMAALYWKNYLGLDAD